jgi:CubicO group peptidase (beta-lactamase class C family)
MERAVAGYAVVPVALVILPLHIQTIEETKMKKTRSNLAILFILLVTACASPRSVSVEVPEPEYWPTAGWKSSTPEAQGMDSELLASMIEDFTANDTSIYSLLVIRNGYMVTEAYFHPYMRDTKMHIQSVTKSVIGILVGKSIKDGYIKSENEKLVNFYQNRIFDNPSQRKNSIQLKHLLSMSSGLDCQEFSSGTSMEQTQGWLQFMLDLPVSSTPGKAFGYCNGNAHLLSSILEKSTGMSAREYANQTLFRPLGIPAVDELDWGSDPQKITMAGYGLHLRPVDMAKLAFLYLHNGQWEDQQIILPQWVAESTTQHIQKEDGSGYGYLWTVYPQDDHYAALGLGGQQIHVYPSKNLIVVVTASLESFAEAPEIEKMLREYVLPAIQAGDPVAGNPTGNARLQAVIETASHPVEPVPPLPGTALDISGSVYTFDENIMGWKTLEFVFEEGAETAQLYLSDFPVLEIGMDNLYRLSGDESIGELLLRGRWVDEQTFVIDYPYPAAGTPTLGELGETEFQFRFAGDTVEVAVEQLVFGGEVIVFKGSR